jgi:plastocyanin
MSRLHVPKLLSLSALALVGLAACGGGSSSATTAPADADVVVRAQPSIQWDAASYTATSHDGKVVVSLIDDGSTPHNLHIIDSNDNDADPKAPKMGVDSKGDEVTGTFSLAPGTYRVVCKIPGHGNMKATLTVK